MLAEKAFHFLSLDNLPFTVFNDQSLAVILDLILLAHIWLVASIYHMSSGSKDNITNGI